MKNQTPNERRAEELKSLKRKGLRWTGSGNFIEDIRVSIARFLNPEKISQPAWMILGQKNPMHLREL